MRQRKRRLKPLSLFKKFLRENDLATVDCLKEENMISVEKWYNGEGEDCLFEFKKIGDDIFKLTWADSGFKH